MFIVVKTILNIMNEWYPQPYTKRFSYRVEDGVIV